MRKVIHYCWFGGKPLPKLAKKCIKSWKKYLPEYEIIEWNENNFDVNINEFTERAYKQRKWAFVADVARVYALKEHGGIYFDTDMLVTKNIDFLLDDEFFAGWESPKYVAVGVMGTKNPNHPIIDEMLNFYSELTFDIDNMFSFTIPKILTKILKEKYGLKKTYQENQKLENNICIYARDYFYPISYDRKSDIFTERTCMIHYYDASWTSKGEQNAIKLNRIFGDKYGRIILLSLSKIKKGLLLPIKVLRYPLKKRKYSIELTKEFSNKKNEIKKLFENIPNSEYAVIYNSDWLGVSYATKEIFENTVPLQEIFDKKIVGIIANEIVNKKYKTLIFSSFSHGWFDLVKQIKSMDSNICIKILWHGSNAMHIESYDWIRFKEIFELYEDGIISSIGFVKKSMADFYSEKGYKTEFVMNTVKIYNQKEKTTAKNEEIKIGVYASGDRWVKNFYNQLCAVSLIKNVKADCVPINDKISEFCEMIKLSVSGVEKPIDRLKLLDRLSKNDINVYVTFTECAPMLPLESLSLGVPCITGNNHHYWENHELKKYLVVDEADNVLAIRDKIEYCLKNKEKIIKLYDEWKKDYDIKSKKSVEQFSRGNL